MATPATVSGNIKNLSNAVPSGTPYVRFTLRNTSGNIPRVIGTAVVVPDHTDVYADTTTGAVSGSIWKNSDIDIGGTTGTYYHVEFITTGGNIPYGDFNITGASFDITTATPITTAPVVTPPTGDTTYQRLDGGNNATGHYVPTNNGTQNLGSIGSRWNAFVNTVSASGAVTPSADNTVALGSSALGWSNLFVESIGPTGANNLSINSVQNGSFNKSGTNISIVAASAANDGNGGAISITAGNSVAETATGTVSITAGNAGIGAGADVILKAGTGASSGTVDIKDPVSGFAALLDSTLLSANRRIKFPDGAATLAGKDLAQTFSATQTFSTQVVSSLATGTAPLSITSTTPVANLAATPTCYNAAGTQQTNTHIVMDTSTLSTGSVTVTLSGAAVFTSASSYRVVCEENSDATKTTGVTYSSGSQFTITGTGSDIIRWIAIGN